MSFRLKTIFGIFAIELLFLGILIWVSWSYLRETNEQQMFERGQAIAYLIAAASQDAVITRDIATLERIAEDAASNELVEGVLVVSTEDILVQKRSAKTPIGTAVNPFFLYATAPVVVAGRQFGAVRISISVRAVQEMLSRAKRELLIIAIAEILLTTIFSFLLGSWLSRRLGLIQEGLEQFAQGKRVDPLPESSDELGRLGTSFNKMVQELQTQTERAERFSLKAKTDSLTGLLNRESLEQELAKAMASADEAERLLAVVFVDLNGFKRINDEHGHDVGDEILAAISGRLKASFRKSDLIFRTGGDEFVLLLGGLKSVDGSEELLLRVQSKIREPIHVGVRSPLHISASMGVVYYPLMGTQDPSEILSMADRAMYAAKRGDNPYLRVYETVMTEVCPSAPIDHSEVDKA
jgi:diguanylate cyclase (GGDEF)-like protein